MQREKQKIAGFTLIEVMVTAAVVAIMATIAAPSMIQFMRSARLGAAANQFQADMQFARREAIRRNTRVLICPGNTAGACGTGAAWSSGWLVCYEVNPIDGTCDTSVTADPNPIRVHGPFDSSLSVTAVAVGSSVNACSATATALAAPLRFNSDGTQGDQNTPVTLYFSVNGTWSGAKPYCAVLSPLGNIALTKPS